MPHLLIRKLDDQLILRLQQRAKRHGRSMEEEAHDILRNALREGDKPSAGLGTQIAALFQRIGLHEEIPELRGYDVSPVTFDS